MYVDITLYQYKVIKKEKRGDKNNQQDAIAADGNLSSIC